MNEAFRTSHCRGSSQTSTVPRNDAHGEGGGLIRPTSSAMMRIETTELPSRIGEVAEVSKVLVPRAKSVNLSFGDAGMEPTRAVKVDGCE